MNTEGKSQNTKTILLKMFNLLTNSKKKTIKPFCANILQRYVKVMIRCYSIYIKQTQYAAFLVV